MASNLPQVLLQVPLDARSNGQALNDPKVQNALVKAAQDLCGWRKSPWRHRIWSLIDRKNVHAREVGINDDWIVVLAIFYLYNGCISGCIGYPPRERWNISHQTGKRTTTIDSFKWQLAGICDRSMEGTFSSLVLGGSKHFLCSPVFGEMIQFD